MAPYTDSFQMVQCVWHEENGRDDGGIYVVVGEVSLCLHAVPYVAIGTYLVCFETCREIKKQMIVKLS